MLKTGFHLTFVLSLDCQDRFGTHARRLRILSGRSYFPPDYRDGINLIAPRRRVTTFKADW